MGIFLDDFRGGVKAGRHIFRGSRRKVTRRDRCSDSRGPSLGIAAGSRQRMAGCIAVARAGTAAAGTRLLDANASAHRDPASVNALHEVLLDISRDSLLSTAT